MTPDRNSIFSECQNPENWAYMAAVLQKAAYELDWTQKKDITDWRYAAVHRMLMGFSIENLLKGILIAEGRDAIEDGKLSKELGSHGLCAYAEKLKGITITPDERAVLKELEEYVKWAGRYPIPKTPNGLISIVHSKKVHDEEYALGVKLSYYLYSLCPEIEPHPQLLPQLDT